MVTVLELMLALNPMFDSVSLLPRQEEIDALELNLTDKTGRNGLNLFTNVPLTKMSQARWV